MQQDRARSRSATPTEGITLSIAKNVDYLKRLPNISKLMTGQSLAMFDAGPGALSEVNEFGDNPGELRMFTHRPANLPNRPALVVVLHGCTQTAAAYNLGAGWSSLADRYGFVLLMPQQRRRNNPNLCFNWFAPDDVMRDRGEAASIHQMIEHLSRELKIDSKRVFVTGLSAGGGMTSAMLAAYPETFAGGAIIAGLPHGAAGNLQDALKAMHKAPHIPASELGKRVLDASPHKGPWPKVSVWHGSSDSTVNPINADHIVNQWLSVHGLPAEPMFEDIVDGHPRQGWWDSEGRTIVESYLITGMAHGTPLHIGSGHAGQAGPFMLEAGISSSYHIATFWGLTGAAERISAAAPADSKAVSRAKANGKAQAAKIARARTTAEDQSQSIGSVITRALTAAGLMKPE